MSLQQNFKLLKAFLLIFLISLSLFAQNDVTKRFTFLQQIYFENQHHQYDAFLKEEFQTFLQKYPNFAQNDQILYMLGDVQFRHQQIPRALLSYLKIVVLYPKSPLVSEAKTQITKLLNSGDLFCFVECKDRFLDYMENRHFFENKAEAYIDIYNFIFGLNLDCFNEALLEDIGIFERTCSSTMPATGSKDLIFYWKGQLNRKLGNFNTAEANFRLVINAFKESPLYANALFNAAMLDYRQLSKIEKAKEDFIELINSFPQDAHAALAQFYLAELYADSLDSLQAGIDNYRLFMDAFPQHRLYNQAFKRLTFLLFKAQRYEEAITLIGVNLNKQPTDSTIHVIVDSMAHIFETKFKQYNTAARCYVLLSSQSVRTEKRPFYLFQAARLYYEKLKDVARASDICNRLQNEFPDSPFTAKCKALLKKRIKK